MLYNKIFLKNEIIIAEVCLIVFLISQLVTQTGASFIDQEVEMMSASTASIFPNVMKSEVEKSTHSLRKAQELYTSIMDKDVSEPSIKKIESEITRVKEIKKNLLQEVSEVKRIYQSYSSIHVADKQSLSYVSSGIAQLKSNASKVDQLKLDLMDDKLQKLKHKQTQWTQQQEQELSTKVEGKKENIQPEKEQQSQRDEKNVTKSKENEKETTADKQNDSINRKEGDNVEESTEI
ncbi:hypothetical protein N784_10340 [Pontibacillus litoralis JSM 072002]|uniref:DUF4047 domain-containing protein n=1 Tax=Pontibacillus litoralis JSM 072002 TaxID=1385512 RepID=A0A0A5G887_9BACI|nr:hypothetical protein N784_10340 [Pontibacillus litoralis JSM 072002]